MGDCLNITTSICNFRDEQFSKAQLIAEYNPCLMCALTM